MRTSDDRYPTSRHGFKTSRRGLEPGSKTRKPGSIGEGWEEDLRRGALFPAEEGRSPSIGLWELELKDGRLALIHQPTSFEPPVLVYFGFYLAEVDGRWVVLDEYILEAWISAAEE